MTATPAIKRRVLVPGDAPPVREAPGLRRYRLARVRLGDAREPDAVHAHLRRMYD